MHDIMDAVYFLVYSILLIFTYFFFLWDKNEAASGLEGFDRAELNSQYIFTSWLIVSLAVTGVNRGNLWESSAKTVRSGIVDAR